MSKLRPWLKTNKRRLPRTPRVPYNPAIYASYIRSGKWHEIRRAVLKRDKGVCQDCGKPAKQVHHLTYDRIFRENMEDLISLCGECHAKRHGKIKDYDKSKKKKGLFRRTT